MSGTRFERCMEVCLACAKECKASADAFIARSEMAECVRACRDCADMCVLCLSDLRDRSPLLVHSSRMCAWACDLCSFECGKHADEHCKRCVVTCHTCAEECLEIRLWLGEMELRKTHPPWMGSRNQDPPGLASG